MMKRTHSILRMILIELALVLFLSVSNFPSATAAPETVNTPTLRIGLMTKQVGILAGGNRKIEIVNVDDGKVVGEYAAGTKVRIGLREGKLVVNNNVIAAERVRIVPQKSANMEREEPLLDLNNRRYRGVVEIFRTQGAAGMTAVNVLSIDEYVYAVLTKMLSPEWPEQAIKAQAVAVRTFALYNIGKHVNEGFDLCDTVECQVYEGQIADDPRILKAVEDTRGKVLLYQGYLISAFTHLSSGGYTENSETVISKSYPYLRGVQDSDQTSPYYRWQKKISPSELEALLKGAGYTIGTLNAIEVSKRMPAPVNAVDRGISGRIKTITFIGSDGVVAITGEKVQALLSLPSSLFDVAIAVPLANIDSNITDSYGDRDTKQIQINLPPASSGTFLTDRPGIHRITGQKNETIFIDGFGWGNGLGLSQWGAKTMAEKAINPASDYFASILKHYYQGVTIDKWY
jgi:stage II sporulation protein D